MAVVLGGPEELTTQEAMKITLVDGEVGEEVQESLPVIAGMILSLAETLGELDNNGDLVNTYSTPEGINNALSLMDQCEKFKTKLIDINSVNIKVQEEYEKVMRTWNYIGSIDYYIRKNRVQSLLEIPGRNNLEA